MLKKIAEFMGINTDPKPVEATNNLNIITPAGAEIIMGLPVDVMTETLEYLVKNCNITLDVEFYCKLVDKGFVRTVKSIHSLGCPFDESLLEFISQKNILPVINTKDVLDTLKVECLV